MTLEGPVRQNFIQRQELCQVLESSQHVSGSYQFGDCKVRCFDSMQMSLKTPTIDGGIIQEKVDLILGHLCAHG